MLQHLLIALFALSSVTNSFASNDPQFRIKSEADGDPGKEIELLQTAIEKSYPLLPSDIQDISRKVTFIINHKSELTWVAMGWSAEDDLEYRYPDQKFFPNGTIKVNFGQIFISFLKLLNEPEFLANKETLEGAHEYVSMVIFHELIHAGQYHHHPVRSFETTPGSIVDGLGDKDVLASTLEKVQYEKEAFSKSRDLLQEKPSEAFAHSLEDYAKIHPADFQPGGKYEHLRADKTANMARSEFKLKGVEDFNPRIAIVIGGQVSLPQYVIAVKSINDRFQTDPHPTAQKLELARNEFKKIDDQYKEIEKSEAVKNLRKFFPYIPEVEARYQKETVKLLNYLKDEK